MFKFIGGIVVGALIMSFIASSHPFETKQALKSGTDAITSAIASGATKAGDVAAEQLNAPPAAPTPTHADKK
jgi:hypothetical protein